MREISPSELGTLATCQARWDFRYGGQLAGTALAPKVERQTLSDGRAWGQAMQAFHRQGTGTFDLAARTLNDAYENVEDYQRMLPILIHYVETAPGRLMLKPDSIELELRAKIDRWTQFVGYCDGVYFTDEGPWIVDFKLRDRLSLFGFVALDRQLRYYAWAYWRMFGVRPVGVLMEERLKNAPGEVKLNLNGKPSKVQTCKPEAYLSACEIAKVTPDWDLVDKLRATRWVARHHLDLDFRDYEGTELELRNEAKLIRWLEAGKLRAVRAPSQVSCGMCHFFQVCGTPDDASLIDALFDRKLPKRERKAAA